MYSTLDWMGDIGGLGEACFFLGSIFMALLQFGRLDSIMVSGLYKASVKEKKDDSAEFTN